MAYAHLLRPGSNMISLYGFMKSLKSISKWFEFLCFMNVEC